MVFMLMKTIFAWAPWATQEEDGSHIMKLRLFSDNMTTENSSNDYYKCDILLIVALFCVAH